MLEFMTLLESKVSPTSTTAEQLRDLCYRCRFRQVLETIDSMDVNLLSAREQSEIAQIKANALFEIHDVKKARDTLASLKLDPSSKPEALAEYFYSVARLNYLDQRLEESLEATLKSMEYAANSRQEIQALLGIANSLYSLEQYSKIPERIEQLCSYEPIPNDDQRISFMIFLGNYYLESGASSELARNYFNQALSSAAKLGWTYFTTRAIYGLAKLYERTARHAELQATLGILRCLLDDTEHVHFTFLVNQRFKDEAQIFQTPIEFDRENKRVLIKNKWIALHDKPILFRFMELLHDAKAFVGKDVIATDLWPQEPYRPRIHDPRIFDIAKRVRAVIESYEDQPVVLLSGRLGYKLASH